MARPDSSKDSGASKRGAFRSGLILVAVLVTLFAAWLILPLGDWIAAFREWAAAQGALGWAVFALAYAVLTFLLAPGALLTIAAGLAFGLAGFFPALAGATLGAITAFLGGRYLARGRVERLIATRPRLQAVDAAIAKEGWRIVLLLRLSPVVPFNLQNWALGATQVGFAPYMLASFFGIMPGVLLYVWIGSLGGAAGGGEAGLAKWALLGAGVAATAAAVWLISRKSARILREYGVKDGQDA